MSRRRTKERAPFEAVVRVRADLKLLVESVHNDDGVGLVRLTSVGVTGRLGHVTVTARAVPRLIEQLVKAAAAVEEP